MKAEEREIRRKKDLSVPIYKLVATGISKFQDVNESARLR